MYVVDFTDSLIIALNGANDHALRMYPHFDSWEKARLDLLDYWENRKSDAQLNIEAIKKMSELKIKD